MEKTVIPALVMVLVLILAQPAASKSNCPANQVTFGPYYKVTISPRYPIIHELVTVKLVRVEDGVPSPVRREVKILFGKETVASGRTDAKGEFSFIPDKIGKYTIETSKIVSIQVYMRYETTEQGATCGDQKCEDDKGETEENCPADCTECGNGICEFAENKNNCPDDCIICGDGVCDDAEIGADLCYCYADCMVCGDGICRRGGDYSEDCPEDCGGGTKVDEGVDLLSPVIENWWVLAAIAVIALFVKFRKRLFKRARGKKSSGWVKEGCSEHLLGKEEDEVGGDIEDILMDLMDQGMSEGRIKKQLQEFGVEKGEAEEMMRRAKRLR
ncbi:MAG: hypothetical protein JXB14_04660 [Candidatus Altiarchaeota archaeon]|nr:hypothetical protein [Candidatus Altiarchaeota archaeon]